MDLSLSVTLQLPEPNGEAGQVPFSGWLEMNGAGDWALPAYIHIATDSQWRKLQERQGNYNQLPCMN